MSEVLVLPELKQVVGALLFGARKPLTPGDIRRVLQQVAENHGGPYKDYTEITTEDVENAIQELRNDLVPLRAGFTVNEIAKGYRLENDVECGPWLRQMLEKGKAAKLSRPALESLAIIAYRQPVTRAEIENVRGVAVDQIVRNLLEMQLVRVVGRSELPGRPWLFGTTSRFLEHFGLRSLEELPNVAELKKLVESKRPVEPTMVTEDDSEQTDLPLEGENESIPDDDEEPEEEDELADEDDDHDEDEDT
jgi:segregation and condensation protein B